MCVGALCLLQVLVLHVYVNTPCLVLSAVFLPPSPESPSYPLCRFPSHCLLILPGEHLRPPTASVTVSRLTMPRSPSPAQTSLLNPRSIYSPHPWATPPVSSRPLKLNIPLNKPVLSLTHPEFQAWTRTLSLPQPMSSRARSPLSMPPNPFYAHLLVCILPSHPHHLWLGLAWMPALLPPSKPPACPLRALIILERIP